MRKMIKKFVRWLAKVFDVSFETPFEIVDNLDIFVKDKLNSMLEGAQNLDIATGYFQIYGWQAFAESVEKLLNRGGKVRLLIGDVSRENLLPHTARFLLHLIKKSSNRCKNNKAKTSACKGFYGKNRERIKTPFWLK